jgi:hypothetical protein
VPLPRDRRDIQAAGGGQLEQRELGGVAGRLPRSAVQVRVVAGGSDPGQRDETGPLDESCGTGLRSSRPGRLDGVSPSGVQTAVTRIRFWVRVPVLSVQLTLVDPRVSTADNRLTKAPRRAISRTPTANARVIVGSSPSGTLARTSSRSTPIMTPPLVKGEEYARLTRPAVDTAPAPPASPPGQSAAAGRSGLTALAPGEATSSAGVRR